MRRRDMKPMLRGWRETVQGYWSEELPIWRHAIRTVGIFIYPVLWLSVYLWNRP